MPIDSNIALGVQSPKFESPLNALAQVLQVRHLQNQGDMADFQMQQARRGVDEQNALRRLLSSEGFDISNPQSQRQVMGISPTTGQQLIKGNLDMRKGAAELDEKTFKTANERYGVVQKSLGSLYQDPNLTKDMVVQNGMQLVQAGLITPQMHQQTIVQLPDDPGQLRQFLAQRLKTQLTPEQIVTAFAPKPTQVDNGAAISFQDTNPNSPTYGKATGPATVQKQQTPDSVARLANENKGNVPKVSTDLRKEFENLPEVKNYKQALPSYKGIEDAVTRSTPAADINVVYGLAKLYDPTSVVREGEYATVANSPNIPERVKGMAQYLANGGKLTPETKRQILEEAKSRIKSYEDQYTAARSNFTDISKRSGADPTLLFPSEFTPAVSPSPKKPMPNLTNGGVINFSDLK